MPDSEIHDRAWRDMRRRVFAALAAIPLSALALVTVDDALLARGVGEHDAWFGAVITAFVCLFGGSAWIKLFRCPKCSARWMPGKAILPVRKNCRKCGFVLLYD